MIMANLTLEGFRNFFKYYNSEEHQMLAIEKLYEAVSYTHLTLPTTPYV